MTICRGDSCEGYDHKAPCCRTSVHDRVADDLYVRRAKGLKEYGRTLQPHNGRDALWDAYEEALDLACYLRQAWEEQQRDRVITVTDPEKIAKLRTVFDFDDKEQR